MVDSATTWLSDANVTNFCGKSLARSIYRKSITIGLIGELGAGKTTFLQGFLKGLGINDAVTSPTYALEQRYSSKNNNCEVIHIDLYRLQEMQAKKLLSQTNDFEGIRCVEWVDKTGSNDMCDIVITLSDSKDEGRDLSIEFRDIALPSVEAIMQWRKDTRLPMHICNHCDAVANFASEISEDLIKHGTIVRPKAIYRAALVHDLFKFVDFKEKNDNTVWNNWKLKYPNMTHEAVCAAFLEQCNFREFASIVETHGLSTPSSTLNTIEQKILFYADKRVLEDNVVTLKERFDDFVVRYGNGERSEEAQSWFKKSLDLEKELTS